MKKLIATFLVLLCVNAYAKTYSCQLTNFVSIAPDNRFSSKLAHELLDYKFKMYARVDNYIEDDAHIKFIVDGDKASIINADGKVDLKRIGHEYQFIEKNKAGHVILWTFFLAPAGSPVKGSILIQHEAYSAKTFTHVYECYPTENN